MSKKELGRGGTGAGEERGAGVVDAAQLLRVSYRRRSGCGSAFGRKVRRGCRIAAQGGRRIALTTRSFGRKCCGWCPAKYGGAVGERFGPTLAAEHLASEDGLQIDAETLRRWMLAEGLWSRERKRRRHRQRRERKEHFGELVQMDGSFHAWLEERGPEGCLIDMVDDATTKTLAQLGEQETIWAVADALRAWIERYGVPLALYVDWKNLYKRPARVREQLRGEEPITQFGRMCAKLGIAIIAASSPQAKGRVERMHGTHQDRLVKKLRRKQTSNHEVANVYLEREYFAGTELEICADRGQAGRLSPSGTAGGGIGSDFPAGERTDGQRGLGGALRQSFFPTATAKPLSFFSEDCGIAESAQGGVAGFCWAHACGDVFGDLLIEMELDFVV
ncbi:MAG: ISNCY family transposase [Acidobacteria bacterium]|nr:MAG: ISNCY family transposase [Acidobacteriota bacterium]